MCDRMSVEQIFYIIRDRIHIRYIDILELRRYIFYMDLFYRFGI